jgi:hypothetical protein
MFGAGLSKAVLRPRIGVMSLLILCGGAAAQTVTIDGGQTNQIIEGFGVNANYFAWRNNELKPALDALIDQAGMTLFRVIFNNGWEATNDNSDPNVMKWDYYNALYSTPEFEKLWSLIVYLNQKGITNGIVLNFQGPGPDWMGGTTLNDGYEDEWAEMVASLLIYARNTRHLQFNLVAPNNEPDITGEGINIPTMDQYVTTLHKLAQKLDTNGLSDFRFVAPDLAATDTGFLSAIMGDSLVMAKLAHFGLHSYSGSGSGSGGVYDFIQGSNYPDRSFWMTEFNVWCSICEAGISGTNDWDYCLGTADYLLGHLANGASAGIVWEGYDSYYPYHMNWSFWGILAVDDKDAVPRTYTPRMNFYTLAQLAKFVRPGARGIGLSGSAGDVELLAFYHDNLGQLTIVGINPDSIPVTVSGVLTSLPPIASLDLYYTSADTNLCHSAVVPVTNAAFTVDVPSDSIFTLTGFDPARLAVSVQLTYPAEGAHFSAPANVSIQATASTTTGTISKVAFLGNGIKVGESAAAPYVMTWSNVPPGTYLLSALATNSEGNFGLSAGVHAVVSGPLAQVLVSPADAVTAPQSTQQFTASATDALGSTLDPQPVFVWSVSGSGTIDSNGLFTARASLGGPFGIVARSGVVSGAASVTVSTNIAPSGTGYQWYTLASSTQNEPRGPAAGLNDSDLTTDVHLLPSGEDSSNAYEAAGIVWPTTQSINRVIYINGSINPILDGVFAADFKLQFSPDGVGWNDAGPEWTVAPPYTYNSAASAFASFTFTGGLAAASGVRCVGQVHTSEAPFPPNSWVAFATELQAFMGVEALPLLYAAVGSNTIVISWTNTITAYALESSAGLTPEAVWYAVTNAPQTSGNQQQVTVGMTDAQQFFRLRQQ